MYGEEIMFIRTFHGKHGWSKISLQAGELTIQWGTKRGEMYKSSGPINPGRLETEAIITSSDSFIPKSIRKWILRCISELENLREDGKRVYWFITNYDYGEGPIKMRVVIESYQSLLYGSIVREWGENWIGIRYSDGDRGTYKISGGNVDYRYRSPLWWLRRELKERAKFLCDEGKKKYIKEFWVSVFGKSPRLLPKVYKSLL